MTTDLRMATRKVKCPNIKRWPDDVVGCGTVFEAAPDFEGVYDCPYCGIHFKFEDQDAEKEQT